MLLLYLTYEGLKQMQPLHYSQSSIPASCTLPMRDWNNYSVTHPHFRQLLLYLTYEGLKHSSSPYGHRVSKSGLLHLTYEGLKPFYSFTGFYNPHSEWVVPYLWGIDTKHPVGQLLMWQPKVVPSLQGIIPATKNPVNPPYQSVIYRIFLTCRADT